MFANPPSQSSSSSDFDYSQIDSLKKSITDLSGDVARLVELRARQAQRAVEHATDATREKIGDYPLAAMAGAFALGAVVGLLVTETRSQPRSRYENARDELASYADDLKRSLSRTAKEYSISDRLERMAAALSATDAKDAVQPALDRVVGWFNQAKAGAKSAADAAAAKVSG